MANSLAQASTSALPDGHANIPSQFNTLTLDLSARANADGMRRGARLSLPRFSEHFVLFFDTQSSDASMSGIALGNDVDVSGDASGGGIYYTGIPNWKGYTVNLRLSGQREELDVDSNIVVSGIQAQTVLKNRNFSVAFLLSPVTPVFANGTNTYMTLGASYQRNRRNVNLNGQDQETLYRYEKEYVPQLAFGIVYPFKRISFYASVEYEQELAVGLGLRLQLTKDYTR